MRIITGKVQQDGSILLLFDKEGEIVYPEESIEKIIQLRGKVVHIYGELSSEKINLGSDVEIKFIKIKKVKPVF